MWNKIVNFFVDRFFAVGMVIALGIVFFILGIIYFIGICVLFICAIISPNIIERNIR